MPNVSCIQNTKKWQIYKQEIGSTQLKYKNLEIELKYSKCTQLLSTTVDIDNCLCDVTQGGMTSGLYLLRQSRNNLGGYALSVAFKQAFYHYTIERQPNDKFAIVGGKSFRDPIGVIDYHSQVQRSRVPKQTNKRIIFELETDPISRAIKSFQKCL